MKPVRTEKRKDLKSQLRWNQALGYMIEALGAVDESPVGYTLSNDHIVDFCRQVSNFNTNVQPQILYLIKMALNAICDAVEPYSTANKVTPSGNLNANVFRSVHPTSGFLRYAYRDMSNPNIMVVLEYEDNIKALSVSLRVRNKVLSKYPNKVENDYVQYYHTIHSGFKGWCVVEGFKFYYRESDMTDMTRVLGMCKDAVNSIPEVLPFREAITYTTMHSYSIVGDYFGSHHATPRKSTSIVCDRSVLTQVNDVMKGNIDEAFFNMTLLGVRTTEMFDAALALIDIPSTVVNPETNEKVHILDVPPGYRLLSEVVPVVLFCTAYQKEIDLMYKSIRG